MKTDLGDKISFKPNVLWPGKFSYEDLKKVRSNGRIFQEVDLYEKQLKELAETVNPAQNPDPTELKKFTKEKGSGDLAGAWAFYPWNGTLLHCLGPQDLLALRTNRNQGLVTKQEQKKMYATTVGIAGMSVGSGIAKSLAYSGISGVIKLADHDNLSTSNLNRLNEPLHSIGQPKVVLAARHIYEINPFAQVHLYEQGLTRANLEEFFSAPPLELVVDEIDDFTMKVRLRLAAKTNKIPLIMFTSLGDNVLVDVERYDVDPSLQPFNGLVGNVAKELLDKGEISADEAKRYAVQLVGQEHIPTRALQSLTEIGNKLVGRPQLYGTVAVDAGLAAYLIKRIKLHGDINSGRYTIHFSELFNLAPDDLEDSPARQEALRKLFKRNG